VRAPLVAIAAAAVITLAACSANDNGGAVGGGATPTGPTGPAGALRSQLPAAIAGRGVLRVVGAVGRAPLLFYGTGTTTPEGIEWDLMQEIGRQLGVSVTLTDLPITQLGAAVVDGRADMFMSGFVDLKAFEADGIDFVDYFTGSTGVLVTLANPKRIGGPGGLCGRQVGVMAGTAQQVAAVQLDAACKAAGRPPLGLVADADHGAVLDSLVSGRVDAVLDDEVVAEYTAQESTGAGTVEVVGSPVDPMPYGIGVDHNDPQLVTAVQAALRAIIADGEYDQALARWGGTIAALRTASINAGR
jgi:polar amino acid transport system substrate-binding protein